MQYLDLFRVRDDGQSGVLCDAGLYPIARWGAERAASLGIPVGSFAHHDAGALAQAFGPVMQAMRS